MPAHKVKSDVGYSTITQEQLTERLATTAPHNESRELGYALVSVMPRAQFARERIPGSLNIPVGEEDGFERHFDKRKEIIVYCASQRCSASARTAEELVRRGFERVVDYEAGLLGWRLTDWPIAGRAAD